MSAASAPVSLRGRFETGDIATLAAQLFGVAPIRGRATSTFEVNGRGATLGAVLDFATGRGTLEMRDGQMLMDVAGLQKQIVSLASGDRPAGWGVLAQIAPMDAFDAKFQLRDGVVVIEHLGAVSKGLVANVQGRLGLAAADIDVTVRIAPAATARATGARSVAVGVQRSAMGREALSVRGPWVAPVLSAVDIALTP
jgi:AsmA-like C-terminal region